MAEIVYVLSTLASVFCAILLVGNYRRTKVKLALWTSVCFVGLALNNVLLFVDQIVVPGDDLTAWRNVIALLAMLTLVAGLIWEAT